MNPVIHRAGQRRFTLALILLTTVWISVCDSPRYPELCGSIPEQTIVVGEVVTVQLCFDDPDGEALDFEVFSSDPGVVTAVATGSTATAKAISPGIALVTMVATDQTGLKAQQTFRVVVPNRPPTAVETIDDRELMVGDSIAIDVAGHFSEPDGQGLGYSVAVSDSSRLTASVEGAVVTMVAVAKGTMVVTVTATDPGGLAAKQNFQVKVPNRPPVPVDSIAAREVMVGRADTVDLSPFFSDPDGDPLDYVAAVSDSAVVAATVSGSALTVTGVAKGAAVVTVTATDDEGLFATQRFAVTAPNRPPVATDPIPHITLFTNETETLELTSYFADPDGDPLTWATEIVESGVVAVERSQESSRLTVTAVVPGEAEVAVTATDNEGLIARQTFRVTVPNRPPTATGTIAERELMVGESESFGVAAYFDEPDDQTLTYAATTSDSSRLDVSAQGATVTLVALTKGIVTVTVTATDPGGLTATQTFQVKVPNRPPVPVDSIAAREVMVGRADTVDLSPFFSDPDGDPLDYVAAVSDSAVVAATVSGSALTVTGVAKGAAVVTVTATDDEGLFARQSFAVSVPNRPPMVTDTIPPRMLFKDEADTVELPAYFTDADGDALTWAAETSDSTVVALGLSATDGTLTINALLQGETVVSVTATDTEGLSAQQSFAVTVPNRSPAATDTIPAQTLYKRETAPLDLTRYFHDPDGDVLQYEIESTDSLVATASVNGITLTVQAGVKGEATLTVTATDPGGVAARQGFTVTVLNRAPTVTTPIPPRTIFLGQPHTVDLSAHFADPDGDSLGYSAASSNRRVVRVETSGSTLVLRVVLRKGTAEVTVTATDPDSLTAQYTFAVMVGNREPVSVGRFPDLELKEGDRLTLSIDRYFSDPDRDDLEYTAHTSEPGIAGATTRGGSVTLTGVSEGGTTLTLTATDPEGLAATQTSAITVVEREGDAPVPVGAIPAQTIAEGAVRTFAVSGYFRDPNGDPLTYSATSGDPGVATASVSGTRVTLTGVASGRTSLTVTASDPGGLSTAIRTSVTVTAQGQGPVRTGSIPAQSVEIGQTGTLSVAPYFQDPDGGSLDFAATSANPSIATAAISGSDLSLTGVSEGTTTVRVTATDSDGLSVSQTVSVRVEPQARNPIPVGTIPAQSVEVGSVVTFSAAPYFREPAGASMRFDASISDATIATISTSGSNVTVRGVAEGRTTFTITATNAERLSATQSTTVDVVAGPPGPETVGTIPDEQFMMDDEITIDISPYFTHPDGKPLTYAAGTSFSGVASVDLVGSDLTVRGEGKGSATITVLAIDPDRRSATQTFDARVTRVDPGFHIDLTFSSDVSADLEASVRDAASDWMSILSGSESYDTFLPERRYCGGQSADRAYVDDVHITVAVWDLRRLLGNNVYAVAFRCTVRSDNVPVLGGVIFDEAFVNSPQSADHLASTALHEIAHVLGMGSGSDWGASLENPSGSDSMADTHFPGSLAVAAFNAAGGGSYSGGKVPVQNGGDDVHWRESVMDHELMTPFVDAGANPLSAITIQALADLGYTVNVGLADAYSLPSPDVAAEVADESPTIDLRNDVFRGPVTVIDEEGNVVRVIPGKSWNGSGLQLRFGNEAAPADSTFKAIVGNRR